MKKSIKMLAILLMFFSFSLYIYAEEEDLSPKSKEQIRKAKEATEAYCSKNSKVDGCVYDENNKLYNETSVTRNFSIYDDRDPMSPTTVDYTLVIKNTPLTRGYEAFDGKGQAVFVGCYKYNFSKKGNKNAPFNDGTLFIFKFIYKAAGKCSEQKNFIVPEKGMNNPFKNYKYDGKKAITTVGDLEEFATFNNWTATHNGDCPNIFGYTSNSRFATFSKNKYVFSQNKDDFKGLDVYTFFKNEKYVTRPGCTVSDEAGEAENQKLLDELLNNIKNKSCPSNIEGMSSFNSELESWYKNIRKDNKYRELWSRGIGEKVTGDQVKNQINAAIKDKLYSCQYKICNLTQSEQNAVNKNKASKCKNGCTISRVYSQSSSSKAKCYICDNGIDNNETYKWTEKADSSCKLDKKTLKDQCIGTVAEHECRICLNSAYTKANLSKEKKNCLMKNEIAAELTLQNIELANEKAANNDITQEQEENSELREELFNRTTEIKLVELFFDDESATCSEILGPLLTKIVKYGITIIQIVGAIITILKGMMVLIPAVVSKDAGELKKAGRSLAIMAIILALIIIFKPLVRLIGSLFEYDISCIV